VVLSGLCLGRYDTGLSDGAAVVVARAREQAAPQFTIANHPGEPLGSVA
jgi:hypothetical protein